MWKRQRERKEREREREMMKSVWRSEGSRILLLFYMWFLLKSFNGACLPCEKQNFKINDVRNCSLSDGTRIMRDVHVYTICLNIYAAHKYTHKLLHDMYGVVVAFIRHNVRWMCEVCEQTSQIFAITPLAPHIYSYIELIYFSMSCDRHCQLPKWILYWHIEIHVLLCIMYTLYTQYLCSGYIILCEMLLIYVM